MYPVADSKNVDETRYLNEPKPFKSKDPLGQPADMRAFRNISQSLFHSPNPVSDRSSAMLSIERKFGKGPPSVVAVSNAVPIQDPRIAVDEGQQRQAFHGQLKRDAEGNPITEGTHAERFRKPFSGVRSRHLWTQGNLDHQLMLDLMQNKLNLADLGFNVGRTYHGDIALFDDKGFEMPRLGYSVFDTNKEGQRQYREDTGMPWREARDYQVTGSVDPLLMIPSPDYQSGYVEHEGRAGVPVPPTMAMGGQKGLNQGLATARYGLYFNPDDLTPEGMKVYDRALSGDIMRSEEAAAIFEDAWSIVKWEPPGKLGSTQGWLKPLAPIMGSKSLKDPNKPYQRQIMSALGPLLEEGHMLVEPFMGGGGVTYGVNPDRHIGSDIDRNMIALHQAIQHRPEIFTPQSIQDLALYREGDIPAYERYIGGEQLGPNPIGGPVTREEIDKHGIPSMDGIFYGMRYYQLQARFNQLNDKRDAVGLTPEEEAELVKITWFLTKNSNQSSFRYNRTGHMQQPGPKPRSKVVDADVRFEGNVGPIAASERQMNFDRFGSVDELWPNPRTSQGKDFDINLFRSKKNPDFPEPPEWMGTDKGFDPLVQPTYWAASHMPHGIMQNELSHLAQHQKALRGSNILDLPFSDFIRQKKIPDKDVMYYFDPPYRHQKGQHRWTPEMSDMVGRAFRALARKGKPVAWHDSAGPENRRYVEEGGGHYTENIRLDQNRKARTGEVPEMYGFANMPWLDPEEVQSWRDSKGAWTF